MASRMSSLSPSPPTATTSTAQWMPSRRPPVLLPGSATFAPTLASLCWPTTTPKTTSALARLRHIRADPRVALLADHYAEDWTALWWVRADGDAAILAGPAAIEGPVRLLAKRYPQYRDLPPAGPVIAIRVSRWTGWAAVPMQADAAAGDP